MKSLTFAFVQFVKLNAELFLNFADWWWETIILCVSNQLRPRNFMQERYQNMISGFFSWYREKCNCKIKIQTNWCKQHLLCISQGIYFADRPRRIWRSFDVSQGLRAGLRFGLSKTMEKNTGFCGIYSGLSGKLSPCVKYFLLRYSLWTHFICEKDRRYLWKSLTLVSLRFIST